MFWPKNVLKSYFLTQKWPQMTVFYPKLWHFKKTTLYVPSSTPFEQQALPTTLCSCLKISIYFHQLRIKCAPGWKAGLKKATSGKACQQAPVNLRLMSGGLFMTVVCWCCCRICWNSIKFGGGAKLGFLRLLRKRIILLKWGTIWRCFCIIWG